MMNINNNNSSAKPVSFKNAGILTNTLRVLDTNPMVNAVGIDLFAMVGPRTYVDTKERNKYAGAETFFREFTGTLIVCLSASYFAKAISKIANKFISPQIPINTKSWFSNDSIAFLESARKDSSDTNGFVNKILDSMSGRDVQKVNHFKDIDWTKIEWVDEKKWDNFNWNNKQFSGIHKNLKDKKSIVSALSELIENEDISKSDRKNLQDILEFRLTNVLKADKVSVKNGNISLSTTMHNLIRDSIDFGRDILKNTNVKPAEAINKILKINRLKSIGALSIAATLGLTNQYINRKITEKRTGTKGFVGDTDYQNKVKNKKSTNEKSKKFIVAKILASLGMAAMAISVMKVKTPADFLRKLEFTGPVTSGNAIKTVYAATIIGRFLASDNKDELRETVTRDYLGFLNWLVLGGFMAKGVGNLLDIKRKNLFNISGNVKGVKNWLNNLTLKSHNEIFAQGKEFSKKNIWKLNIAHASGLAYSTLALGVLLPKLNIWMTQKLQKNQTLSNNVSTIKPASQTVAFGEFFKVLDNSSNSKKRA